MTGDRIARLLGWTVGAITGGIVGFVVGYDVGRWVWGLMPNLASR